jgi:nicotinamidase-related amidase
VTPALLLVDVIHAFFDPAGIHFYPAVREVEEPLRRLLRAARASDALVVHAAERHRPGLADFEQPKLPVHCVVGERDAELWADFRPDGRPREILVPKRRYSAFFATDLALLLREQGVDTVVVGGVKTNVCIRATCQDAFAHGFRVVLPREATSSNRPHLGAASLEDVGRYLGETPSVDEVVGWLGR